MSWHYYDFKKSDIVYLLHKYIRILFKGIRFTQPAYMSTITEDQFIASSRRLLNRIFAAFLSCRHQQSRIIALHNAFSPTSTLSLDFGCALFDQFSMIIVDRDPRDIFIDLPKAKYLPFSSSSRAKQLVDFFLHTRKILLHCIQGLMSYHLSLKTLSTATTILLNHYIASLALALAITYINTVSLIPIFQFRILVCIAMHHLQYCRIFVTLKSIFNPIYINSTRYLFRKLVFSFNYCSPS